MINFTPKFDIIGDLHGCYELTLSLINKLGYKYQNGAYKHPENRQIIFVGDLLNRGTKIVETLNLVKKLIKDGVALSVLGNHETLLLLAYAEVGKSIFEQPPPYLNKVHFTSLNAYQDNKAEFFTTLDWLFTLPLALEFENFRVAHAGWRETLIADFFSKYKNAIIDANFLIKAKTPTTWEYEVREALTQGMRFNFNPEAVKNLADFKKKRQFRAKFWLEDPKTYGDIFFHPFYLPPQVANFKLDEEIKAQIETYKSEQKNLFVGHYWLSGTPAILAPNIACVDYSAVKGGPLVAYRYSGEAKLTNANFVAQN